MFSYSGPWIPRADEAFRSFANGFCNTINANPARYMLTRAEADSLMGAIQNFQTAFGIASSELTRNKTTIANKDDARSILQDRIESYGAFIRVNRGIADGDKIAIGVRPKNISHKRRRCPTAPPLLNFIGSLPGMDQLVFHASNTPTSKAKPYGAERLELWVAYSAPGASRPTIADARPVGSFKKSKMIVQQDPQRDVRWGASGTGTGMPTYWARWVGYDNQVGPWSLPCNTTIKAKMDLIAAASSTESAGDQPLKLAA